MAGVASLYPAFGGRCTEIRGDRSTVLHDCVNLKRYSASWLNKHFEYIWDFNICCNESPYTMFKTWEYKRGHFVFVQKGEN